MLLCGIDVESTGTNIEIDKIIEVGMVLWDTESNQPIKIYSEFVKEQNRPPITEHITKVTGLTEKIVTNYGIIPEYICQDINIFFECADYVVAHNGNEFDKVLIEDMFANYSKEKINSKHWIDTLTDVEYPEECSYKNLLYLQAFHGFISPLAHRAVLDVLAMFKILMQYDLNRVIEISKASSYWVEALVSFEKKDFAKEAGFRWLQPEGFSKKHWLKKVKSMHLENEQYAEFEIKVYKE